MKLADLITQVTIPPRLRKKTDPTFGSRARSKKEKKSHSEKKRSRTRRDWD
jgi:hypothetical protein